MSDEKVSLRQLDLLKEIASIGSASAATALSDLIDNQVDIIVPQVELVPLDRIAALLGGMEKVYFVSVLEINGDIEGTIFLLFSSEDSKHLVDALLKKINENGDKCVDDELYKSCIKESANILCGAYVSALAEMTNFHIGTSIPFLARDMVGAILDFIFINLATDVENALVIKTDMNVSGSSIEGLFLLFPNSQSLKKIFDTFGLKE